MGKWDDRVAELMGYKKAGLSAREIADIYGVSASFIRGEFTRLRQRGLLPELDKIEPREVTPPPSRIIRPQTLSISFPDKKQPTLDYRKFLSTAIDLQSQLQAKGASQGEATINITSDKPIALMFTADWHIGSQGVDYVSLLRHLDLILKTPNLFFSALGDQMDNFIKSKIKSAMLHTLFGPQEQHDVLEQIFEEIGHKCLFATAGNHDDWTDSEAGIDIARSFYKGIKSAPYLREGGGVNINFNDGEAHYRVYAKHKYRFHSSFNPTNSPKRMHELESPFDIGVVAHRHIPTFEHTDRWSGAYGKDVIYVVTGTYKVSDAFARANGYGATSNIGVPTVVLFPRSRKMIPFKYVEDAVMFLEAFR